MSYRTPNAKCIYCGEGFYNRPSTPNRKTCSKECNSLARKIGLIKSGATKKLNCTCSICNKDFYRSPKHQERSKSGKLYCSIECQHVDQKKPVTKVCKWCGEEYKTIPAKTESSKYCSFKCASEDKFSNPEMLKKMRQGFQNSPNKLETYFFENTPEIVKFTGDGKVWINFNNGKLKNPDFVIDGTNKVIELFGDYWHKGEDTDELIQQYKEVGYDCLVFWESEIRENYPMVLARVLSFVED